MHFWKLEKCEKEQIMPYQFQSKKEKHIVFKSPGQSYIFHKAITTACKYHKKRKAAHDKASGALGPRCDAPRYCTNDPMPWLKKYARVVP